MKAKITYGLHGIETLDVVQSRKIKDYATILEEFEHELGPYIAWTLLSWCGILPIDDNFFWELFLVKRKKKSIGIAGVYSMDNKKKNLWLGWFGVVKDERRQMIGKSILLYCEILAYKAGGEKFFLYTSKDNKGAIAFYKKNGFKLVSSVGQFIKNNKFATKDNFESMDDIVMSKNLI